MTAIERAAHFRALADLTEQHPHWPQIGWMPPLAATISAPTAELAAEIMTAIGGTWSSVVGLTGSYVYLTGIFNDRPVQVVIPVEAAMVVAPSPRVLAPVLAELVGESP